MAAARSGAAGARDSTAATPGSSAELSDSLSGWYSQVSDRGWVKLTETVLSTLAAFFGTTNGADT